MATQGYATPDELVRYFTGADEVLHAWTIDNQLQFPFDTGALSHTLVTGITSGARRRPAMTPVRE
jgi:iron complex outermembrane receptor protein